MSDAKTPPFGEVGYKKPPEQHRFKKGRSGNPAGRRRKAAVEKRASSGTTALGEILLTEAMRPIKIRENDEVIELPMIQAALRSLGVAAVKGDHRAQLAFADMVKAVQTQRSEELEAFYLEVYKYKEHWLEVFADCDRAGQPRPEPIPHPDDVVLNDCTLQVRFNGPIDLQQKAKWDDIASKRQGFLEEVEYLKSLPHSSPEEKAVIDEDLAHNKHMCDLLRAIAPDERTRRAPGFDLQAWRNQQSAWQNTMAKRAKRKRTRT